MGVVRWHGRISWLLERLSSGPVTAEPSVRSAAALGIYQLLYLDRIPDHAAVDTSVNLARRSGGASAAGWTNAILRRVADDPDQWRNILPRTSDPSQVLSAKFSHPRWMISRWLRWLPREQLENLLAWNNRRPKVCLRIDRRSTDLEAALSLIRDAHIAVEPSSLDANFIYLEHPGDLHSLEVLRNGMATVQDVSQGLVGLLVNPRAGMKILDLCAAPGGKTGHIAELCPDAEITATDKSADRLKLVSEMSASRKWTNVTVKPYEDILRSEDKPDIILIDAPCTGTGVLARRPDLRWRRSPADIGRMSSIQLQLLRYATNRIAPGGALIYSTCSLEPEENRGVVTEFLATSPGFVLVPPGAPLPAQSISRDGFLELLGPESGSDGVFAARLEKRSADSGR